MSEQGQQPDLPGDDRTVREVEYFESSVVLTAAVVVRRAGGWSLLSAGQVSEGRLWAEFEKAL